MTKLSVNLNKVALIRNSRITRIPDIVEAARTCIAAGAEGITVHPRPDQRHIRPEDVYRLAELLQKPEYQAIEFNIEGNPFAGPEDNGFPGFMKLVEDTLPDQCTLVPDSPAQLTSDHGWNLTGDNSELCAIIDTLRNLNIRVSLFMDPVEAQIRLARECGADRIEFYTGPYADHYGDHAEILRTFVDSGRFARQLGLGLNAGHDLNRDNLGEFCRAVEGIDEVSIGHAIVTDALWLGFDETIRQYSNILAATR